MRTWLVVVLLLAGCNPGSAGPVAIDTAHDACDHCRMIISDTRFAAQIVAPGEEPRLFDDIGCLRDYVRRHSPIPQARVFVADHRTGEWIDAARAIYTRSTAVKTPMASGIIAHASIASRDGDHEAAGGEDVPVSAILGVRDIGRTLE